MRVYLSRAPFQVAQGHQALSVVQGVADQHLAMVAMPLLHLDLVDLELEQLEQMDLAAAVELVDMLPPSLHRLLQHIR